MVVVVQVGKMALAALGEHEMVKSGVSFVSFVSPFLFLLGGWMMLC